MQLSPPHPNWTARSSLATGLSLLPGQRPSLSTHRVSRSRWRDGPDPGASLESGCCPTAGLRVSGLGKLGKCSQLICWEVWQTMKTKPKKKAFASFCSTASSVASHRREHWPVAGSWGGRRGATYRKAREVPGAPPRDEPDPSREDGPKILIFIHVRNKQIFFFFYKSTSEFISVLLLKENIPP